MGNRRMTSNCGKERKEGSEGKKEEVVKTAVYAKHASIFSEDEEHTGYRDGEKSGPLVA